MFSSCKQELIAALQNPACYPHPAKKVRLLETHISWVLLAGHYAYKIKKPVNLGFLDFSELNKRHHYCNEEIRLNQRLAPKLYLDVIGIGGTPGQPVFGAEPVFEYAVRMRRFPAASLLVNLLFKDNLTPQHLDRLAITLADFHTHLEPAEPNSDYGTPKIIAATARQNFEQLGALLKTVHAEKLKKLRDVSEKEFSNCLSMFKQRQKDGFIRECHGDLHLGNITLIKNTPVPFDGIEFNPALRWIDVINDIAFLIMDLQYRHRPDFAFRFLNRYMEETGDYHGLGLLRFYMGYRAIVRAKILAIRASQNACESAMNDCISYLSLAGATLAKGHPALIVTYGLPGCGKTTISQIVLEKFQFIRLRSDVERKRLCGMAWHEHSGGDIYDEKTTQRTYAHLLRLARELLALGYPVIIDAAFLKRVERQQFQTLAQEIEVPFVILSVQAKPNLLKQRIQLRQHHNNDASEADFSVLEKLQTCCEPLQSDENSMSLEIANDTTIEDLENLKEFWKRLDDLLNKKH